MSNIDLIKHNVRIIPAHGDERNEVLFLPPPGKAGYFRALNAAITKYTGDPMEHVRVFTDFGGGTAYKYLDMFVNETGHLIGLPINAPATVIYQHNVRFHEPNRPHLDMPEIAGDAVLFENPVWR